MSFPISSPVRWRLQAATRKGHNRFDARLLRQLDRGPDGYRDALRALAGGVVPLEAALEAAGAAGLLPDWPQRRRTAALLADLATLGAAPAPAATPPVFEGEAAVFGALYVLEGSRLGARALLKQALRIEVAQVQEATRHLRHGEGRPLWSAFLERLEASAAVQADPQKAIEGAEAAFALLEAASAGLD